MRPPLPLAAWALALSLPPAAFAAPAPPAEVGDPAKEWTVAAAAFDTSALDAADRLAGDLVPRTLASAAFSVGRRRYDPDEREAYARRLQDAALELAVKDLASKQASRDALLFAGNAEWKYRVDLAKADGAVSSARAAFDSARSARAVVPAEKPVKAAKANEGGAFFAAPKNGEERSFCAKNGYDALLLGSVESFYGRLAVSVRLYSPHLDRDLFADSTVFSAADRDAALSELSLRLSSAVSGSPPALLAVRTEPPDADILLDGQLSGRGRVGPVERRPGEARILAEAPGHESFEATVPIAVGERTDVEISLPPLRTRTLRFAVRNGEGGDSAGNVRVGGLHAGVPAETVLPEGRLAHLEADDGGRRQASAVVRADADGVVSLSLVPALPAGATPTEDARRAFYGAFGRFSLILPFAFIVSGIGNSYADAATAYGSTSLAESASLAGTVGTALWAAAGVFVAESVFRFIRYVDSSGARAARRIDIVGP